MGDSTPEALTAQLGFARADQVVRDRERPGRLRARQGYSEGGSTEFIDAQRCELRDWQQSATALGLKTRGFDWLDLGDREPLQACLAEVRANNHLNQEQARCIRQNLTGKSFRLSGGGRLRVLMVAGEGMIMRRAGPNGLDVDTGEAMSTMNGHRAAAMVHGDQDVYGTPLRQMLKGAAPWLFRHDSPDGHNRRSPLAVINLWIPLQQITQPLVLMDRQTLNRQNHQLRFAEATGQHLERNSNDTWLFLHDEAQQWYFSAELDARQAYVFDTLGTPHGAATLPGEEVAEQCYRQLQQLGEAVARGDQATVDKIRAIPAPSLPDTVTAPLGQAIATMLGLLEEARSTNNGALSGTDWCERAARAMDRVVRKSIEVRAVAWLG